MTDAEILSMAYDLNAMPETMTDEAMCRLVRAAVLTEREACAKICDQLGWDINGIDCSRFIRARSDK